VSASAARDQAIVRRIPRTQLGLARRDQLTRLGMTPGAVRWRLSTERWREIVPGVVATFTGRLSPRQRLVAAGLYAGENAQITGTAALRERGLKYLPDDDAVHVLVPHGVHKRSTGFVVVRTTVRMDPRPMYVGLVAVTSAARAIADAAAQCRDIRTVRAMVGESVQSQLCLTEDLVEELARMRRNGSALLRRAVDEVVAGVRSVVEAELRAGTLRSKVLPTVLWNPSLTTPDGRNLPTPDGWIDEVGIAIEADSREYHLSPEHWERTLARHALLTSLGAAVLHFPPSRIRRDVDAVVRVIERTYLDRRAAGIRPSIRATQP
jgi:hypothetical protein